MIDPFKKLMHPEKFVEKIDVKKICASPKIYKNGVDKYKEKILAGEAIRPIVVLKHPQEDLFAVLDGHHRFYAFSEIGAKDIEAAVIRSNKFLFDRTKEGWLQPTPRMTKFIRIPAMVFTRYVNNFVKNPKKVFQSSKSIIAKYKNGINLLKNIRKKTEKKPS